MGLVQFGSMWFGFNVELIRTKLHATAIPKMHNIPPHTCQVISNTQKPTKKQTGDRESALFEKTRKRRLLATATGQYFVSSS